MDEDVEGVTAIAGAIPMHTISKELAKREKRARFPTSEREKYFGVASGSNQHYMALWPPKTDPRCSAVSLR